jgi:hypothetical protein
MPIKLATQMPPLSLTLVAPRLNSRSSSRTSFIIFANVLTYTKPPRSPSQKMIRKMRYTEGRKKNRECSVRRARLAIWRREGR